MNSKDKKLCHFVLYLDSLEGVVGRWMGGGGDSQSTLCTFVPSCQKKLGLVPTP